MTKHTKQVASIIVCAILVLSLVVACAQRDIQEMGVTNLSSLHLSDDNATATPALMVNQDGLGEIAVFMDAGTPVASFYDGGDILFTGDVEVSGVVLFGGVDLDGNELILDADGDTSITADTDDLIDFMLEGVDAIAFEPFPTGAGETGTSHIVEIYGASPAWATGTNVLNLLNIDVNVGNAQTGTHTINGILIDAITADAQVTENAIAIGTGWDIGLSSASGATVSTGDLTVSTGDVVVSDGQIDLDWISVAAGSAIEIDIVDSNATDYVDLITAEWTPSGSTPGGSNGIYAISNPIVDLTNAYALRGRMDMQDQKSEAVSVNQLHAVDALINLSNQVYTVTDNISVFGAAVHSVGITAGDIVAEGSSGGSLNMFYGMWGDSMTEDFSVSTVGSYIGSHAGTYLDYGYVVANSGTMTAGLVIENHASNSPAAMEYGIYMESASDHMASGIDMSNASFTGDDIVFQNGTGLSEETDTVLAFTEFVGATEQSAVVVTEGSTITPTGTYQPLTSSGAVTTSTSIAIADGSFVGQLLILVNENGSDEITIDNGGNTHLSADIVLGNDDTLMLLWDGADWLEIGGANNS